jgi:hypothetical protein
MKEDKDITLSRQVLYYCTLSVRPAEACSILNDVDKRGIYMRERGSCSMKQLPHIIN